MAALLTAIGSAIEGGAGAGAAETAGAGAAGAEAAGAAEASAATSTPSIFSQLGNMFVNSGVDSVKSDLSKDTGSPQASDDILLKLYNPFNNQPAKPFHTNWNPYLMNGKM